MRRIVPRPRVPQTINEAFSSSAIAQITSPGFPEPVRNFPANWKTMYFVLALLHNKILQWKEKSKDLVRGGIKWWFWDSFLIFPQNHMLWVFISSVSLKSLNISCEYWLDALRWDASNEYQQYMFLWKRIKEYYSRSILKYSLTTTR